MSFSERPYESNQYYNTCLEIDYHFAELLLSDCVYYLSDNPGTTGQDVLDHQNIVTINQVLENPIDYLLEKSIIPTK